MAGRYGPLFDLIAGPVARRAVRGAGKQVGGGRKVPKKGAAGIDWGGVSKGGHTSYEPKPRLRNTGPGGWHIYHQSTSGDELIWVGSQRDIPGWEEEKYVHWGGGYVSSGVLSNSLVGAKTGDTPPADCQTFTHTTTQNIRYHATATFPDEWEGWQGGWAQREHDPWWDNHKSHVNWNYPINLEHMQIGSEFDILQIGHNNGWYEYDLETNEQVFIAPIAVNPKMGTPGDRLSASTYFLKEWGMTTHVDGQYWWINEEGKNGKSVGRHQYQPTPWYVKVNDWWFDGGRAQKFIEKGILWHDKVKEEYRHWFDVPDNKDYCMLHPFPYMAIRHKIADQVCDVSNLEVDDISSNVVLFEFIPNYHYSEHEHYVYEEAPIVVKNYPPSKEEAPDHPEAGGEQRKQACVVLYHQARFWSKSKRFTNVHDVKNWGEDYSLNRHIRWYAGNYKNACPLDTMRGFFHLRNQVATTPRVKKEVSSIRLEYKRPAFTYVAGEKVTSAAEVDVSIQVGESVDVKSQVKDLDPHRNITACQVGFTEDPKFPLPRGLYISDFGGQIHGRLPRNTPPGKFKAKVRLHKLCTTIEDDGDGIYTPAEQATHKETHEVVHSVVINFDFKSVDTYYNPVISEFNNERYFFGPKTLDLTAGQQYSTGVPKVRDKVTDYNDTPGHLTWSVQTGANPTNNIPPGMSFNAATGEISGNPTEAGMWDFVLSASNGNGSTDSISITIVVAASGG